MKKLFFILLIFISLVGLVFANGDGESYQKKSIRVGASLLTQAHPFYQAIKVAMESEAKNQSVDLNILIANQDLNQQLAQVEDFITQQYDVIIITPVDSDGIKGAILKAQAAKIPVITVDIKANDVDVTTHIATDNYTGGRIAGEAMAQFLNKKGEVGLITYPEIQSVKDRISGFKDQVNPYQDLKIVTELPGRTREAAKSTSEDMLTANPNLLGIFGFGDDMAIAATNAISERGSKAIVVGFDGLEEAIKFVDKENAFLAVVKQYPNKMGKTAIEIAAKIKKGEEVPNEIPIVPGLYIYGKGEVVIDETNPKYGLSLQSR